MQATGVPSASSETRKPSGSAAWKAAASSSPGFHPSRAAHSIARPTSSRAIARILGAGSVLTRGSSHLRRSATRARSTGSHPCPATILAVA